jgi:hypothetical protein
LPKNCLIFCAKAHQCQGWTIAPAGADRSGPGTNTRAARTNAPRATAANLNTGQPKHRLAALMRPPAVARNRHGNRRHCAALLAIMPYEIEKTFWLVVQEIRIHMNLTCLPSALM